jgi:exodeoxyribonuclease V alpha subunit
VSDEPGGLGARSLNIDLQQALNRPGEMRVERFGSTYKVMQVENDYDKDVYNGDRGVVRSIDPEASEMVVEFDGRPLTYGFSELDESCWPTPPPPTRAKAPSIRLSSSR